MVAVGANENVFSVSEIVEVLKSNNPFEGASGRIFDDRDLTSYRATLPEECGIEDFGRPIKIDVQLIGRSSVLFDT